LLQGRLLRPAGLHAAGARLMGDFVVKVDPERDAYLVISNNSDQVIAFGDRESIIEDLFEMDDRKRERIPEWDHGHPANRIARADQWGSSSMMGDGRWDDESLLYCAQDSTHGQQLLAREHFGEVYDRYVTAFAEAGWTFTHPDLQDLLTDIEDD